MLYRKIESELERFYENDGKEALLIDGARQVGKTTIIRAFAQKHFDHFIEINFIKTPQAQALFQDLQDEKEFQVRLSAFVKRPLLSAKTLIFFDEVQRCPEVVTYIKFLVEAGHYYYILSGSLLGVELKNLRSAPVGYLREITMYPLDFEEFLWANGISEEIIALLKKYLKTETPVTAAIHKRMNDLLRQYAVVGGMPEAVNTFISTHNISQVIDIQRGIVDEYKDDMVKYADDSFKNLIRECFESIPKQLSKENKKFQYSVIKKGGRATQYYESLQWIEDAGIAKRCYNLSVTELPLDGNAKEDVFKVYMQDTGLFLSMLEYGTQADVLKGNLLGYKGAIYENLMADILSKMGRKLYYFHKDSGLEVDFVIRYKGKCTLLEVKASSGNVKSTKTILKHPEVYHVTDAIKLGDYNVGRDGQLLTLPFYMGFLLTEV